MSPVVAHFRLLLDILSVKAFVWMFGKNDELLDSHLFFFDKYSDLADYHRLRGRIGKADRLLAIAEAHFRLAPDDEPPEAAAMAMPAPASRIRTNAVGSSRVTNTSNEHTNLVNVSQLWTRPALRAVGSANDRSRRDRRQTLKRGGAFFHAELRVCRADGLKRRASFCEGRPAEAGRYW